MPNIIRHGRRQTNGVALVVTLSMLAIVALLAVAFVLTARTEVKSGTAYNDQAAAKSLAKMAVDRALMEIVRQGQGQVISGGETSGGQPSSPSNSYIYIYSTNDFTRIDNWTNDLYLMNNVLTTDVPYGPAPGFDFVELDGQLGRSMIEPYWIAVRSTNNVLQGQFAYVGTGGLVDLNAIGNIASSSHFYNRPADTNFGYGYLGNLKTNATPYYSRGICADISMPKFLQKLGYNTTTVNTSAFLIVMYRYGWPAGKSWPVGWLNSLGVKRYPGGNAGSGIDNNNDGFAQNPSEYTVYPNLPAGDQALSSLSQIWTIPIDSAAKPSWTAKDGGGAPYESDPAHTNLAGYASTGPSADPNLVSPAVGPRVNLNAMTNGTPAIVATNVMLLTNVLWHCPQFTNNLVIGTNQLIQVALNLIDFHTTNRYPTTFVSGTKTYTGIKPTPYINQILIRYDTTFYRSTNVGAPTNGTNYWFRTSVSVTNEIWNPYPGTFPDTNNLVVTNIAVIFTNSTAAQPVTVGWSTSCIFTSPRAGFTTNYSPIATNVYCSTALGSTNVLSTGYYSNWIGVSGVTTSGLIVPGNIIITNIFMSATLCGSNAVSPTNLIQKTTTPITNILTVSWTGNNTAWNAAPWNAGGDGKTNSTAVVSTNISLEADDPRMGILYNQTLGGPTYTLGSMNTNTCFPTNSATMFAGSTNIDTWYREGTNSFYYRTNSLLIAGAILTNSYISIGDIGYVHRGEPWATIRLQPYTSFQAPFKNYPYGDGGLLDYFRVSDLIDVAGRINLNIDLNGPAFAGCVNGGTHQSPALFALFSGITNLAYTSTGKIIDGTDDNKIVAIIQELGAYRASLTNSVVGGTLASINGTNGVFTLIGQLCAITNLTTTTTDLGPAYSASPAAFNSPPSIPYTDDANREALIRAVANLVTTWQGGGTAQIIGWGQVVKGGDTTKSNGVPGQVVKIMATFQNVGGKIRIISYQYIP